MSIDNEIKTALREVPNSLTPPPGLADDVLTALNRQRRMRIVGVTTAVVAIVAAVPVALSTFLPGPANTIGTPPETSPPPSPIVKPSPVAPREPVFPRPGGGAQALHLFVTGERMFLLDPTSGEYQAFAFSDANLSPDLRSIAVADAGGRVGIADRASLLRDGVSALTWTDINGAGLAWSPDGKAVVVTEVYKSSNQTTFVAQRYDIETQKITNTHLPAGILGQAGWATDSRRYIVLLTGSGPLQYIEPDGTFGQQISTDGGFVGGAPSYSPSRDYVIVDSSHLETITPIPSRIVAVVTGSVEVPRSGDRSAGMTTPTSSVPLTGRSWRWSTWRPERYSVRCQLPGCPPGCRRTSNSAPPQALPATPRLSASNRKQVLWEQADSRPAPSP